MIHDATYLAWGEPFFADEEWMRTHFGEWQQKIRLCEKVTVTVDFSAVKWVDPLMLMSLLAEVIRAHANGNIQKLILELGRPRDNDAGILESRTRKYLVQHKWLEAFGTSLKNNLIVRYRAADNNKIIESCGDSQTPLSIIESLIISEENGSLLYTSELLIEPTVIYDADWERAVANAISRVDEAYFRQSLKRRTVRGTTLQRLRAVMRELVRNAIEHAYRNVDAENEILAVEKHDKSSPVVIYARTRQRSDSESYSAKANRPRPMGEILEPVFTDQYWIEACVVDVGKGLWTDAPLWASDQSLDEDTRKNVKDLIKTKNSGLGLSNLLWRKNLSRFSRALNSTTVSERGRISGLTYLNAVLGISKDWVNWYSDTTWRYSTYPVENTLGQIENIPKTAAGYIGTCYRIAMNVTSIDTKLPSDWFIPANHSSILLDVAKRFSNTNVISVEKIEVSNSKFLELRHGIFKTYELNDLMDRFFDNDGKGAIADPLVRVPRSFDKNLFARCLNKWIESLCKSENFIKNATMIIADVSRAQARNLQLSLLLIGQANLGGVLRQPGSSFPSSVKLIVLCDDLSSFAVTFKSNVFVNPNEKHQIISASTLPLNDINYLDDLNSNLFDLKVDFSNAVLSTLVRLRISDSKLFWDRTLVLQDTPDACVWGPVKWESENTNAIVLDHYLDFSAAMKDGELSKIMRRALRRSLALFPGCELESVDSLVDAEIGDAVRWFADDAKSFFMHDVKNEDDAITFKKGKVLVGSVRVTGRTLKSLLNLPKSKPIGIVDCFVQPSGQVNGENIADNSVSQVTVLNWNPQQICATDHEGFEQEPGTPYIRRSKNKYLSVVPLLSADEIGASRLPHEMYRQFAADGLIKIGHWHYGDRHSLIEVDTASALSNFGSTYQPLIDEQFFGWLRLLFEKIFINESTTPIVAYIPQRLTQSIIKQFKRNNQDKNYQYIPIHLLQGVAGGLGQLSDMTLYAIESANINGKKPDDLKNSPIVILDIGFISKRTLRHIRRQLAIAGYRNIIAVGLLNRSSSPAHSGENVDMKMHTYWRWNTPILGRASQCSVCAALRVYKEFSQRTLSEVSELSTALAVVRNDWVPASMTDMWRDMGFEPSLLAKSKAVKFGFRRNINYLDEKIEKDNQWHFVEHRFATTLTAHYIELARYTGDGRHLLHVLTRESDIFTSESRVECLAAFLILCGSSLNFWVRVEYLKLFVEAILNFDHEVREGSIVDSKKMQRRIEQILGLCTLTALGLDENSREALGNIVDQALKEAPVESDVMGESPVIVLLPCTRIFFLASLDMPSSFPNVHFENTKQKLVGNRNIGERKIWENLERLFGRGPRHRGIAIESFEDAISALDYVGANATLSNLAGFLSRCDANILTCIGIEWLHSGLQEKTVGKIESLVEIGRALMLQIGDLQELADMAKEILNSIRNSFQSHLLRCERPQSGSEVPQTTLATILPALQRHCGLLEQVGYFGKEEPWIETRSMIWCTRTQIRIRDLLQNASRSENSIEAFHPLGRSKYLRKIWLNVSQSRQGVTLRIENCCSPNAAKQQVKKSQEFLKEIKGSIIEEIIPRQDRSWYVVTITIPWVESFK